MAHLVSSDSTEEINQFIDQKRVNCQQLSMIQSRMRFALRKGWRVVQQDRARCNGVGVEERRVIVHGDVRGSRKETRDDTMIRRAGRS